MRGMWWVWIFPLIGIGMLIGAVFAFIGAKKFQATAQRTIGTVVDYHESYSQNDNGSSTLMFAPVYEYEAAGQQYRQTSSMSSSHRDYKLGQRIRLLYAPDKPGEAQIDNPVHTYMAAGVIGFIGLVFCIIGFICVAVFAGPRTELVDTPAEQLYEYGSPPPVSTAPGSGSGGAGPADSGSGG